MKESRSWAFGGMGCTSGPSRNCMVILFAAQSNETRAVGRPLRSSTNSTGRRPSAVTLPRLEREIVPFIASTPRPLVVSWISYLPAPWRSSSVTSPTTAVMNPLYVDSYVTVSFSGGSAAAAAHHRTASAQANLLGTDQDLGIVSLNAHPVALDDEAIVKEPANGARIDDMLLPHHAGVRPPRRVSR